MTESVLPDSPTFTLEDVQRQIDEAIQKTRDENAENLEHVRAQHQEELDSIRASLGGGGVISPIPAHSGGPGTEVRQTWSLAEQTEAREAANAR